MRPTSLPALFLRSLYVSSVTVGGGYVILSVLKRYYTVRKQLISDEDMTDISVMAQTAPGAVAVNAALLVGYRLRGIPGALVSVLGTLIPPTAVMSALVLLERAVSGIPVLSGLMLGMRAGAAAVILDAALDALKSALSDKNGQTEASSPRSLRTALFAVCLVLCLFTGLSSVKILAGAALAGGAGALILCLRERAAARRKPIRRVPDTGREGG